MAPSNAASTAGSPATTVISAKTTTTTINNNKNHSPFRHIYGTLGNGSLLKKEAWDAFPTFSLDSNDSHLIKTNGKYISVNIDRSGSFQLWPTCKIGRFSASQYSELQCSDQHSGLPVLDTAFSPVNPDLIVSAGEDGRLVVWNIETTPPTLKHSLVGRHDRRVVDLEFPTENIFSSASHDGTVKIWDLRAATTSKSPILEISLKSPLMDHCWLSPAKTLLTSSKDRCIRTYDTRGKDLQTLEIPSCHTLKGVKLGKVSETKFISTGFGKQSEREIMLWDSRAPKPLLAREQLGIGSAPPIPLMDIDRQMLYVALRGESSIRYWNCSNGTLQFLNSYTSLSPIKGLCQYPQHSLIQNEWEVGRFLLCHQTKSGNDLVQSVHMVLPRREGDCVDSLSSEEKRILFPSSAEPLMELEPLELETLKIDISQAEPLKMEPLNTSKVEPKSPLVEGIEKINTECPSIMSPIQHRSTSPNVEEIQLMMKELRVEMQMLQEKGKDLKEKIDHLEQSLK